MADNILEQAEKENSGDVVTELNYSNLYNSVAYERVEFFTKRGQEAEKIQDFLEDFLNEKSDVVAKIFLSYIDGDKDPVAFAKSRKSDACIRRYELLNKIAHFTFYFRKDNEKYMRVCDFLKNFNQVSRSHMFCVFMNDYINKNHGNECMSMSEKLVMIKHKQDRLKKELKEIQRNSGFSKSDFDAILKNNGIEL